MSQLGPQEFEECLNFFEERKNSFYFASMELEEPSTPKATSGLADLPFEVLVFLFSFLDVQALGSLACASRQMYQLANDRVMWKPLCYHRFSQFLTVHEALVYHHKKAREERAQQKQQELEEKRELKERVDKEQANADDAEDEQDDEEEDEDEVSILSTEDESIPWHAIFKYFTLFEDDLRQVSPHGTIWDSHYVTFRPDSRRAGL